MRKISPPPVFCPGTVQPVQVAIPTDLFRPFTNRKGRHFQNFAAIDWFKILAIRIFFDRLILEEEDTTFFSEMSESSHQQHIPEDLISHINSTFTGPTEVNYGNA
jgi:hypothetical protein